MNEQETISKAMSILGKKGIKARFKGMTEEERLATLKEMGEKGRAKRWGKTV